MWTVYVYYSDRKCVYYYYPYAVLIDYVSRSIPVVELVRGNLLLSK